MQRLVALACVLSLVACTTLRPVGVAGVAEGRTSETAPLAVGDSVVVTLKTGASISMRVSSVSSEALVGVAEEKQQSILLSAVAKIERQEASRAWMVVVVLAVVALLQLGRGVAKVAVQ